MKYRRKDVGTKVKSTKQGLTSAKDLPMELSEGHKSPNTKYTWYTQNNKKLSSSV